MTIYGVFNVKVMGLFGDTVIQDKLPSFYSRSSASKRRLPLSDPAEEGTVFAKSFSIFTSGHRSTLGGIMAWRVAAWNGLVSPKSACADFKADKLVIWEALPWQNQLLYSMCAFQNVPNMACICQCQFLTNVMRDVFCKFPKLFWIEGASPVMFFDL